MFGLSAGHSRAVAVAFMGKASAGCAVLGIQGKNTTVLAFSYTTLSEAQMDATRSVSLARTVVEKAATAYSHSPHFSKFKSVVKSYGILHAPLLSSRIAKSTQQFSSQQIVSDALIAGVARDAFSGAQSTDLVFESSVVQVHLNGYPTSTPKGKKATTVEVRTLISSADAIVSDGLKDILMKAFPVTPLIHSDARALLTTVVEETRHHCDALILHVTREATNAVVLRGGAPDSILHAEVGIRDLVSAVGEREDAMSLLRLAVRDICRDTACEEVHTALARAEPEMVKKYGELFVILSKQRKLPRQLVLVVHPDFAPWFSDFLARIDFAPFAVTSSPFEILIPSNIQSNQRLVWSAGLQQELALTESIAFVNSVEIDEV